MKILGHPIHMMLIHFPSALFPMSVVCSAAYFYTGNVAFSDCAFFTLTGGVIAGWLAAVAGLLDLTAVVKDKPTAVKKALIHGGINSFVLIGFSLFLYKASNTYPAHGTESITGLIIKGALVAIMIIGNFIGGSLVLKDRINAEK